MRYRCIILFGKTGSGKTILGRALGALPGFVHFSTGQMFRQIDLETDLGKKVAQCIDQGELVPDHAAIKLWQHYVGRMIKTGAYHPDKDLLLLDGIPINKPQNLQILDYIRVARVIHLVTNDDAVLIERAIARGMREGRKDDADPEVIRKRIHLYAQETAHVINSYKTSLVAEVDAIQKPVSVLRAVIDSLEGI